MITTPQEYIDSIEGAGREWLLEFAGYMQNRHPHIKPVMFRQRPMYKVGKSYVMFTATKTHFSMHTLNFELIEELKQRIPQSGKGKGCVSIKYTNEQAKPILKAMCDRIIEQNSREDAPPVDVSVELPYGEQMDKVFALSKAKWRPLYAELLAQARQALPEFREHFPAVGILWKHDTTFAGIKLTQNAMCIEFYSDRLHAERNPVKHVQPSAKRVMHLVEVQQAADFAPVLEWRTEANILTATK